MPLSVLGISRLSSSAILDFRTTAPLCSNLYYRSVFLTKTFLNILETCANIFSRLYATRTYLYCMRSTKSSCILLLFSPFLLLRTKRLSDNNTSPPLRILSNVLSYTISVSYYMLGSREALRVLALCILLLRF